MTNLIHDNVHWIKHYGFIQSKVHGNITPSYPPKTRWALIPCSRCETAEVHRKTVQWGRTFCFHHREVWEWRAQPCSGWSLAGSCSAPDWNGQQGGTGRQRDDKRRWGWWRPVGWTCPLRTGEEEEAETQLGYPVSLLSLLPHSSATLRGSFPPLHSLPSCHSHAAPLASPAQLQTQSPAEVFWRSSPPWNCTLCSVFPAPALMAETHLYLFYNCHRLHRRWCICQCWGSGVASGVVLRCGEEPLPLGQLVKGQHWVGGWRGPCWGDDCLTPPGSQQCPPGAGSASPLWGSCQEMLGKYILYCSEHTILGHFYCFSAFISSHYFLYSGRTFSHFLSPRISHPVGGIQTESVTVIIQAHVEWESKTQTLTPCQKWTLGRRVCGGQREWLPCRGVWGWSRSSSDLSPLSADLHTSRPPPSWTPAEPNADNMGKHCNAASKFPYRLRNLGQNSRIFSKCLWWWI